VERRKGMTQEEYYRKQVCESYGKNWKKAGKTPPKGDGCEECMIKWKCKKAWKELNNDQAN